MDATAATAVLVAEAEHVAAPVRPSWHDVLMRRTLATAATRRAAARRWVGHLHRAMVLDAERERLLIVARAVASGALTPEVVELARATWADFHAGRTS